MLICWIGTLQYLSIFNSNSHKSGHCTNYIVFNFCAAPPSPTLCIFNFGATALSLISQVLHPLDFIITGFQSVTVADCYQNVDCIMYSVLIVYIYSDVNVDCYCYATMMIM